MAASPVDPAATEGVTFESAFLAGGSGAHVDVSRFAHGNIALPGVYSVDVDVRNGWHGRKDVTFRAQPGKLSAAPCFDKALLTQLGVSWVKLAQVKHSDGTPFRAEEQLANGPVCGDLSQLIPEASAAYDVSTQTLDVSIPQLYLNRQAREWVDPSEWDYGVTAATLSYNASSYTTTNRGRSNTNIFASVNAGLNVGGWRLRHTGSLQTSSGHATKYQPTSAYIQRDVTAMQSQLTIGDSYTDGNMFDGMSFRGAALATDDRMLPDSQRGYAPVIRGVADTNAEVTIRQRGVVLYQTSVPPGPFQIDDLYPTGYAGDLQVSITEADGRVQTFTVPYAATPQSLRPGIYRYSVLAGQLTHTHLHHKPNVVQGTWQRGLNNTVTGYAGVTAATGYTSGLMGVALNTRIGAVTLDWSKARTQIPGAPASQGDSLRLGYSTRLNDLGTSVSLASYRYSTSGYLSLNDAMNARAIAQWDNNLALPRQRGRLSVNLTQPLGQSGGSLYVSGSAVKYWQGEGDNVTYSAGYGNRFRSVSYGLSIQRTHDLPSRYNPFPGRPDDPGYGGLGRLFQQRRTDTRIMFTVSVPLGNSSSNTAYLSTNLTHDSNGTNARTSVQGSLGDNHQFNYGASLSRQTTQQQTSFNANAQYSGSNGTIGVNYGRSGTNSQFGLNASGGIVFHAGGATLSQQITDTNAVAIVHVPGGKGAAVSGGNNVKVDSRGYAIVPYITPYKLNTITIDPKDLPLNIELKDTAATVAPRSGAVVRLKYGTVTGHAALIDATYKHKPVPFGADVLDAKGNSVGSVGQAGRIIAYGLAQQGKLTVSWGSAANDKCVIDYALREQGKNEQSSFVRMTAQCIAPTSTGILPTSKPIATASAADILPMQGAGKSEIKP